jgi:hypothetical protein
MHTLPWQQGSVSHNDLLLERVSVIACCACITIGHCHKQNLHARISHHIATDSRRLTLTCTHSHSHQVTLTSSHFASHHIASLRSLEDHSVSQPSLESVFLRLVGESVDHTRGTTDAGTAAVAPSSHTGGVRAEGRHSDGRVEGPSPTVMSPSHSTSDVASSTRSRRAQGLGPPGYDLPPNSFKHKYLENDDDL